MKEKVLFVIMPFGVRALADGRPHDFDQFYNDILKPVGQAEGYQVVRVDELVEAGTITNQALRNLYSADIVLADVSAPNSNVYYELGVRQAISSGSTILVAVEGTVLPFDIATQRVFFYNYDFSADAAFRRRYRRALHTVSSTVNPVQAALQELGVAPNPHLNRAAFERELDSKITRATRDEQLVAVWHWAKQFPDVPVSGLMSLAERLANVEDYATAAVVLTAAYPAADGDYEVHRQKGFYLRKLGDLDNAIVELNRALELNPNDPQTLGMLGGAVKRQGLHAKALEYYERAVRIAPRSLYLRVARAGMTILADPDNSEAAQGMYSELRDYIADSESLVGDYWADLVAAEANFVLGDFSRAREHLADAIKDGVPPGDAQSTAEQIRMLGQVGLHPVEAEELADSLVRAARSGERSTPFLLLSRQDNSTFSRQHLIFHISDVHFGTLGHGEDARKDMHRFADDENSNRLSLELREEFQKALAREKSRPEDATIVLSGDLVYTGKPEEFTLAQEFLGELCAEVGLSREQVVIVPGNHDIDWEAAKSDLTRRFDNYLSFVHDFYGAELFYRFFPLVKWDFHVMTDRPRPNEIIYVQRRENLTIVGLNSCVFEDHQHHYGFVGLKQLNKVSELLPEAAGNDIRIAVMHHHLHPYPEALGAALVGSDVIADMSTVRDAGIVEQRLARLGFSVLLHGHKHKPQLRETIVRNRQENSPYAARSLMISGCGSTGVAEHELEHNQSNHYAIVKLLRAKREPGVDFARVEWRELAVQAGAEWVTAGRWVLKG